MSSTPQSSTSPNDASPSDASYECAASVYSPTEYTTLRHAPSDHMTSISATSMHVTTESVRSSNLSSRHAFLILAHKNLHQLGVLIQLLDHPDHDIIVHLDTALKATPHDIAQLQAQAANAHIRIISTTHVTWGSDALIRATLELLTIASRTPHAYYHLLSGQDLPIVSNTQLHAYFAKHQGEQFVSIEQQLADGSLDPGYKDRVDYYWPLQHYLGRHNIVDTHITVPLQRLLHIHRTAQDDSIGKGHEWFSITEDFAQYVVARSKQILARYRHTHCADEIFMQTTLLHSPFATHTRGICMRYIDWNRGGPYTFTSEDFNTIMNSGNLFARKFDETKDTTIIQRIANALQQEAD